MGIWIFIGIIVVGFVLWGILRRTLGLPKARGLGSQFRDTTLVRMAAGEFVGRRRNEVES